MAVFLKRRRQEWLRRWPGHCAPTFLLSPFPSKVRERLFCQTPWPLWVPLLRAWIKPFEKEIFYINGQPSNKLLQSSLPNHLVSHGELAPTSAPSPLWFLPSSSSLEADTHEAGGRASSQPGGQGRRMHRCTREAFQVQRGWPSREWGQLLNTQPEPWRSGSYRVLCIRDTAWPLPCRHHIRLELPKWCVYSPQRGPPSRPASDHGWPAAPSCSLKQATSSIASGHILGLDSNTLYCLSIWIRSQCSGSYCIYWIRHADK